MYRILFLALALAGNVRGQGTGDSPLDRATLRGLQAINVVIDPLDAPVTGAGLSPEVLVRLAEDRLKSGGVPVDPKAVEFLGIRLSSLHAAKKSPYSLCLTIGLYQSVALVRNRDLKTATQTWESGTLLLAPPKLLTSSTLDALNGLVDRFVAAWKSANK